MMASGARFLREPFVHFVVAGALVFAAEALYGREAAGEREPSRVVFEASDVARLATLYRERVGREPSREELEGLVEDAVREEIYYREALALGLDEGDSIVRRRLVQKMEFIAQGRAVVEAPDEAALRAHLEAHPEITAGEFRDLLQISRKYAIPLLEHFDNQRLTIRLGDKRVLRKTG